MKSRLRRGAVGLLLAALLAPALACGSDDNDSRNAAADDEQAPGELNTVVVSDPGTGEATELRWQPQVGDTAVFEVMIRADTVVEIDELEQEAVIGPGVVTFDASVTDIGPAGEVTTEYVVVATRVPDGNDPGLETALERLTGTLVSETVTARGIPLALEVVEAEPLGAAERAQLDRFVQQLAGVFPPLPEGAVAEGAMWSFTSAATVQGVQWVRSASYTLAELDGPSIRLEVNIADRAAFQEVDPAGPTNLEGSIEGSGSSEARLDTLAPRAAEASTELDADIFTGDRRTGRTANRTGSTLTSLDSEA